MTLLPNKSNFDYKCVEFSEIIRKTGSFDQVLSFVKSHGGIDAVDEYHRTALMNLCIDADKLTQDVYNHIVKELVQRGADINKRDKGGYTALHFAVQNKNKEMVNFLLAQPDIQKNSTPNLLHLALLRSRESLIPLLKAGVDPFDGAGLTPYQFICDCQSGKLLGGDMTEILELLKEMYPDRVESIEPYFLHTIQYDYLESEFYEVFKKKKFPKLIEFLNAHGGIDGVSERGRTALIECMVAYIAPTRLGYKKIANPFAMQLIALGANVNATDRYGYTAMYFAEKHKNEEMINHLLAHPNIVTDNS